MSGPTMKTGTIPVQQVASRGHDGRRVQPASSKCYSLWMTLEDIEQAIANLSPEDRAKLRLWLAEFEAGLAEQREPETKASKLGRLAGRAVADFRKRMRES